MTGTLAVFRPIGNLLCVDLGSEPSSLRTSISLFVSQRKKYHFCLFGVQETLCG